MSMLSLLCSNNTSLHLCHNSHFISIIKERNILLQLSQAFLCINAGQDTQIPGMIGNQKNAGFLKEKKPHK